MFDVARLSAIRSRHRPTTLIQRVAAALPALPNQPSQRPAEMVTRVSAALAHVPHRASHRRTTLITRVTAALPDLPHHRYRKRDRPVWNDTIVKAAAGLVGVLIGTAAVVFRNKLARRGDGGGERAPDTGEHTPASIVRAAEHKLASIVSRGNGSHEHAPDTTRG